MNWLALLWFVLMVLFLVMEASTVTLVSLWFVAGALVAMLLSLFNLPLWIQIAAFFAVSILLLVLLRSVVKKYLAPKLVRTNVDAMIGATGYVTVYIDNMAASGQVKIGSMYWTARTTGNDPIPEGTFIQVDRVEGVKVFVSPAEIPAAIQ